MLLVTSVEWIGLPALLHSTTLSRVSCARPGSVGGLEVARTHMHEAPWDLWDSACEGKAGLDPKPVRLNTVAL